MTDGRREPAGLPRAFRSHRSELFLRICSALLLIPVAIVIAYFGGLLFVAFWAIAATGIFWEWTYLVAGCRHRRIFIAGTTSIAVLVALVASGQVMASIAALIAGSGLVAVLATPRRRIWVAAGLPYAGAVAAAPIIIRSDVEDGLLGIIFLFAIVWATDTIGYFFGRAVGGPKLIPQFSPGKTWAGAVAGTAGAIVAGLAIAIAANLSGKLIIAMLAGILSVVAQAGDLLESVLKRRFGAKDSGRLIPGHGGLMDRLDGFVAAGLLAMIIGIMRGDLGSAGRGLLEW
jgi:phosphatidate cytidylyltransferase